MEDFDIFTNEINFTKPLYTNILNKLVYEAPSTPNGPNYESGRKLLAEECLAASDDVQGTFHLSEAVCSSIRTMAVYREEQRETAGDKLKSITSFIKPIKELIDSNPINTKDDEVLDLLLNDADEITSILDKIQLDDELPFFKRYLKFTKENNVENFHKILNDLPKEWTIVQLTAPYNPNENLKPHSEYRTEVDSIYVSVFTNDYLEESGLGPFTVHIPANVTKEGEKPLFIELYSILDENYRTIDNAHSLNNKRLVQNYWNKREDIDLRMKSVINVMDKQWLGGWGSLLTGRLVDARLKDKVIEAVDRTVADWGFIRLTKKQKVLLYNLIESCPTMSSSQTKTCIRRILSEHGNTDDIRKVLQPCERCKRDFKFVQELCLQCLAKCFEKIHHFTLVDGIKAFSQLVTLVKDGEDWTGLKKAERHPVILIVDEILDTFPWETLPILNHHPVSRIENIHFLYYLYCVHRSDVIQGYYVTQGRTGRYIINPEKNLDRMEKRMNSFVQYWCKDWSGYVGQPPPPDQFIQCLTDADIFLYCGHGDGCQFASGGRGAGVERAVNARAVCLLSGCGSVRLHHSADRAPPTASHRRLHITASPMVIGMLWEVTDLEVDKVVTTLLSLCVRSAAAVPWTLVGKRDWSRGVLDTKAADSQTSGEREFVPEPNILRAVARSRGSTNFVMIASSVVARGLPVRIR